MNENDFYVEEHEMTKEEVKAILEEFELKYGMASDEFYEKWKRGETDLVSESVAWSGLFEAYQSFNGESDTQQ